MKWLFFYYYYSSFTFRSIQAYSLKCSLSLLTLRKWELYSELTEMLSLTRVGAGLVQELAAIPVCTYKFPCFRHVVSASGTGSFRCPHDQSRGEQHMFHIAPSLCLQRKLSYSAALFGLLTVFV